MIFFLKVLQVALFTLMFEGVSDNCNDEFNSLLSFDYSNHSRFQWLCSDNRARPERVRNSIFKDM